jgi:hypothetical protein
MSAYDTFISALESYGCESADGKMWQCPAHDDRQASLSIAPGEDDKALVYCHAGCRTEDVVDALGLTWTDLFGEPQEQLLVAEYIYEDMEGHPHIRVLRYQPKTFRQQHMTENGWEWGLNGVGRIPYRLPELLASEDSVIYVTEGEKDADNLAALGVTTTTFLGGAGKWRDEYGQWFYNREVCIVADNDEPGRAGADTIALHLRKLARSVRVVVPAEGKDVSDHIRAGLSVADLVEEGDGLDEFGPLDWDTYEADQGSWLLEPYVPRAGRVLAFGPAGSLKSLWAMWVASYVAKEGGRVAYFSLEMQPTMTAQRLRRLAPPKENFYCFTKDFRLGSPSHTEKLMRGLREFDLIVIDSWTAARAGMKDSNEQVSELDTTFFLPIIRQTGATVIIIDNTGHPAVTDKGVIKMQHARGASAKGDKMDVTLWFDRPYEDNNYLTRISCKKMRYDRPIPKPIEVYTPTDHIEFYYAETGKPMWPGLDIMPKPEPTAYDEVAAARLKDRFGALKG